MRKRNTSHYYKCSRSIIFCFGAKEVVNKKAAIVFEVGGKWYYIVVEIAVMVFTKKEKKGK